MSTDVGRRDGSPIERVGWGRAARYGAGAFAVAFGACGVLSVASTFLALGRFGPVVSGLGSWLIETASFAFWGSHVGAFGSPTGIRLGFGAGPVPGIVYLAVPVVALLAAGYRSADGHARDRTGAAYQGAATAAGYGVLVVASVPLVSGFFGGGGLQISVVQVGLSAGVAYPVVFGGLGGYVAGQGEAAAGSRAATGDSAARWSSDADVGQSTETGAWSSGEGVGQSSDSGGWSAGTDDDVGQPDPEYARQSYCPACGTDLDPGDNYCPNCGEGV